MADTQSLSESERIAWAAWASVPQISPRRIALLRETFGELAKAWRASDSDVSAALQREDRALTALLADRRTLDPQENWSRLTAAGVRVVTVVDDDYPTLLKETHNAPAVLFYRGTLPNPSQTLVAVVGTRVATAYGKNAVARLVEPLAQAGLGIVSGLALGIDGLAHEAALAVGGQTFAVVGTGLDQTYPPQHAGLAARIVQAGGAIISEFPLGTGAQPYNFPQRNRIVAGMCVGTLVVEAGEKSGALLTAKLALDENREVFCVPGDITRETSAGTNKFIRLGAHLATGANDVLTALNLQPSAGQATAAPVYAGSSAEEKSILRHLSNTPVHVDELAGLCDCDPSVITATLAVLELQGHVRHVGGMHYTRN